MTPKQKERVLNKIAQIKKALASDKRRHGGFFDDSRGLRYLPPELYIKIEDYNGSHTYFKWFKRVFSEDYGFPFFMFEWTLTLFKVGKLKDAETKAIETFERNIYIFDKFLGRELKELDRREWANIASLEYAINYFQYSSSDPNLADFSEWLINFLKSPKFIAAKNEYLGEEHAATFLIFED